jgi:hypothetical protein
MTSSSEIMVWESQGILKMVKNFIVNQLLAKVRVKITIHFLGLNSAETLLLRLHKKKLGSPRVLKIKIYRDGGSYY